MFMTLLKEQSPSFNIKLVSFDPASERLSNIRAIRKSLSVRIHIKFTVCILMGQKDFKVFVSIQMPNSSLSRQQLPCSIGERPYPFGTTLDTYSLDCTREVGTLHQSNNKWHVAHKVEKSLFALRKEIQIASMA